MATLTLGLQESCKPRLLSHFDVPRKCKQHSSSAQSLSNEHTAGCNVTSWSDSEASHLSLETLDFLARKWALLASSRTLAFKNDSEFFLPLIQNSSSALSPVSSPSLLWSWKRHVDPRVRPHPICLGFLSATRTPNMRCLLEPKDNEVPLAIEGDLWSPDQRLTARAGLLWP